MVYKVWAKEQFARYWCYDFFRATVDGVIYSCEKEGQTVRSAIILVRKPVPQSMFDHYFLDYEIISND
jgi:hypothetical protein